MAYHSPTPWGGVDGISRDLDALEKSRPDYVQAAASPAASKAAAAAPAAPAADENDTNELVRVMSSGSKIRHIVNEATAEAMDCAYFMKRWDAYKTKADTVAAGTADGQLLSEFDAMTQTIIDTWKLEVEHGIEKEAAALGVSAAEMPARYANDQIQQIENLGYKLSAKAKGVLMEAFSAFYFCSIGPAPFSVHAVAGGEVFDKDITVTCAEHMLQMATHFVRNPPSFMTADEMEELLVLACFHDAYYFSDFANHGERCMKLFEDFLEYDIARDVVGGHLSLVPDKDKLRAMEFDSPLDALKQEWCQMDWYLTMVNMKQKAGVKGRPGDAITLPIEFFHHHIGRLMTKQKGEDRLIRVSSQTFGKASWDTSGLRDKNN